MEMKQTAGVGINPLEVYGRNINNEVLSGKIDPVIGREDEIRRIIEILSRKTKNNPVLIGEPGVGKTAIVEGLAQRIVHKDVPENLLDKQIWELSLSSIISGASYQGQFEQRLNDIIKEVKKSNGNIILFIDEIHQLVDMGKSSGSLDAANILKPMMARGEIKIIGATTINEYRKYIEKDAALERRMSKILVNEPSKQETLTIMRGLKERWEVYHKVQIHDSALVSAVDLSTRYITDRYLPDKAIDLVDEAAAKIQTQMCSMPEELDKIRREIIHLSTEKAALSKETDPKSKERLDDINKRLDEVKSQDLVLTAKWKEEKQLSDVINVLKKQIDECKLKVEEHQIRAEYASASKLLYVTIPELEKKLKESELKFANRNDSLVKDSVTDIEIGEVISKVTGIPLNKLIESEKEKIINLPSILKKRVKGQDDVLKLISDAILRSRAGINDPNRPIGSFLFLGPTGVGKTEVAKSLADALFDSEKAIIRFDMSEFGDKHTVSKLIGSPPGYIGFDQGGELTEAVRTKPYSVVLFDEIEKAHPDVLNILLQILDDGQLHDSHGRFINFKNTIIIMTSNIGSEAILKDNKDKAIEELKLTLKPELLNRIDEIILFNKLNESIVGEIATKLLDDLSNRLFNEGYNIKFGLSVVDVAKVRGYDEAYGVRPLKRWIQKHIENELALYIIKNEIHKEHTYNIEFDPRTDKIIINK